MGEGGFCGEAGGGEQVGVAEVVLGLGEVAELDQAFVDEGAQAIVELAVADPRRAARSRYERSELSFRSLRTRKCRSSVAWVRLLAV